MYILIKLSEKLQILNFQLYRYQNKIVLILEHTSLYLTAGVDSAARDNSFTRKIMQRVFYLQITLRVYVKKF